MAMVKVRCPYCKTNKVNKNGKSQETGAQRYLCNNRECFCTTFMLEYAYKGAVPGIDETVIDMTANASGIRDTARVLGISTDKVMSVLKKHKLQSQTSTTPTSTP